MPAAERVIDHWETDHHERIATRLQTLVETVISDIELRPQSVLVFSHDYLLSQLFFTTAAVEKSKETDPPYRLNLSGIMASTYETIPTILKEVYRGKNMILVGDQYVAAKLYNNQEGLLHIGKNYYIMYQGSDILELYVAEG